VQRNTEYVTLVRDLIANVRERAAEAVKRGKSLEEFRSSLELSVFVTRFVGTDARRKSLFDLGFTQPGAKRAFEEASFQIER
jgi:hypothetical protein